MNIEELIKNLDPVTIIIIEFKNYITEKLSKLCSTKNSNSKLISKFKTEENFVKNVDAYYIKTGKPKLGFKNIFVVDAN